MKKPAAIIMLILGILLAVPGLAALAGGAVASAVGAAQGDGYLTSSTNRFSVSSYAITSPRMETFREDVPGRVPFDIGTLRLRAESASPGKEVFIGIGPQADVERYLSGVHRSELLNAFRRGDRAEYRDIPGDTPATPPAGQGFWTTSVSGPGQQELTWDLAAGTWEIVVMNADASSGVDVRMQAGFRSELIGPAATGLLVGGTIALLIGIPLIVFGAMGLGRHAGPPARPPAGGPYTGSTYPGGPYQGGPYASGGPYPGSAYPGSAYPGSAPPGSPYPAGPAGPGATPAGAAPPGSPGAAVPPGPIPPGTVPPGAIPPGVVPPESVQPGAVPPPPGGLSADYAPYPARLYGELDPRLSRWMWLVKWFLAIPHFIILFFLWFAFIVTTIVAGFAILFTGRYPRPLFDFNVGVLRWNWRVAFYAYAAVGTDVYPPFTLARTNYPADFEVDYPQRLSRGLVLIKWWLLAIPHLLLVAAFAGTTWRWEAEQNFFGTTYERGSGLSLLGLLVLVAAVALLFTGRYLRPLFDLILGINRWIYRVIVYTALMRDEYPPFRLDLGAAEPPMTFGPSPGGPGPA
ncbi:MULTISPECIES: DUF4389 domain-containing protein [unclassified Arthrobacter]|uniref:DUF4389 domain-containing protein n=1 Tax=unclassified Arthrobacter TaxID=235627 RepID=UPI001C85E4B1|nr:DUF4389 domain-containing protein [Arthrobacter sp. MAHUQ-56]MBX7444564.1 DUF4389 domain-containing protein [Arthrobacter sp. MAHUQ-56]